jgi:hypothetical protein
MMKNSYTKDDKEKISKLVFEGMSVKGMSCFKACEYAGVPNGTFMGWLDIDSALTERYVRAREDLIERIAAETIEIADKAVPITSSGSTDSGAVQKQRLQVDTRKWLLARLAPKKYGDRLAIAGDEGSPLKIEQTIDASKLSTSALAEIIAAKDATISS